MKKRLLSMTLVLSLLCSILPGMAMAEEFVQPTPAGGYVASAAASPIPTERGALEEEGAPHETVLPVDPAVPEETGPIVGPALPEETGSILETAAPEGTAPLRESEVFADRSVSVQAATGVSEIDMSAHKKGLEKVTLFPAAEQVEYLGPDAESKPTYSYKIDFPQGTEEVTLAFSGVIVAGKGSGMMTASNMEKNQIMESTVDLMSEEDLLLTSYAPKGSGYTSKAYYSFRFSVSEPVDGGPIITRDLPERTVYSLDTSADPLTVAAEPPVSGGTLSYQWYAGPDPASLTPVDGAGANTYVPATDEVGAVYYQVAVINTPEDGDPVEKRSTVSKVLVTDPDAVFSLSAFGTGESTRKAVVGADDTVFCVSWPSDGPGKENLNSFAPYTVWGIMPYGQELDKVWGGAVGDVFDLDAAGAYDYDENSGVFMLSLANACLDKGTTYTHHRGRCLYFTLKGSDTVHTLVVDSDATTNLLKYSPSTVTLYDTGAGTWPEEFQVVDLSSEERTSSLVRGTLASDDPIVLRAQVWNKGTALSETSVKPSAQRLQWPDGQRNWVLVNGQRTSDFFSADDAESSGVFSQEFTLQPGLNVVEVYSNLQASTLIAGNRNSKDLPVFGLYDQTDETKELSDTTSVVYLIDYQGRAAQRSAPGNDTSLAMVRAVQHGHKDTKMTDLPFVWDGENDCYVLTVPESYRDPNDKDTNKLTGIKYCHGVLLSLKPVDAGARVEVVNEKTGSSPLVLGTAEPCTFLDINALKADGRFTIRVTAADGETVEDVAVQVQFASSDASLSGVTVSGAALDVPFDGGVLDHYLDFPSASSEAGTMTLSLPEKATATVNGTAYTGGTVALDPTADFCCVVVTAEDGVTQSAYYFVTRYGDGTIPFSTISPESEKQARDMLSYWYERSEDSDCMYSYWDIFMSNATGRADGSAYDFNGKYVYDVSRHTFRQSTDWAACIMELIILGENPYDFPMRSVDGTVVEHFNYVERLEAMGGGAFANNVWYMIAANAAGADLVMLDWMKDAALRTKGDLDTRAWEIAALSGVLDTKEMVRYVDSLHDVQDTDGKYVSLWTDQGWQASSSGNLFTIGCVLSAIASVGADPDKQFAYGTDAPLDQIQAKMFKDGMFYSDSGGAALLLPKDMIIGLGDVTNGSNMLAGYALTWDKYNDLLSRAQTLLEEETRGTEAQRSGLRTKLAAATAAKAGKDESDRLSIQGLGEGYYALRDAMEAIQPDLFGKPSVIWGMPYQLFEDAVALLPEADALKEDELDTLKAVIDQYEAMDESNRDAVSLARLSKYRGLVRAALILQDETETAAALYGRILALPDPLLAAEDDRVEVEAIRKAYDTMAAFQRPLIDWAGASVLLTLQKVEAALGDPSGGGGGGTPAKMTIDFRLLGAPNDGEDGTVHTLKDDNLETWYEKSYTFNASSLTAERAFRVIMGDAGIAWRGNASNQFGTLYIAGIQSPLTGEWMEEFTTTSDSGWMYTVNGKHPGVGVNDYTLKDGDEFIVHYTDDYTLEQGSEEWHGGGSSSGKDTGKSSEVTTAVKPEVTVDRKTGEARAEVTAKEMDAAIQQARKDKATAIVIAPDVKKDAPKVTVTIPGTSVNAVAKEVGLKLSVQTPQAQVTLGGDALSDLGVDGENPLSVSLETLGSQLKVEIKVGKTTIDTLKSGLLITVPVTKPTSGTILLLVTDEGAKVLQRSVVSGKGLTALLPGSATIAVKDNSKSFSDVPSDNWAADAVNFAASHELFRGTGEDAFSPTMPMSRAMLVTVLHRLESEARAERSVSFADVDEGAWYTEAVTWAASNEIVMGTGAGFDPDGEISREQLATMLYRYAKSLNVSTVAKANATKDFTDAGQVSEWAAEAMSWAVSAGLIGGKENKTLDPAGTATRAEVAAILQRSIPALFGQ